MPLTSNSQHTCVWLCPPFSKDEPLPINAIRLSRPVETTPGCRDLQELLRSLWEFADMELAESDVALMVRNLWRRAKLFFFVQLLVSGLLLGYQVFAVLHGDVTNSIIGLSLLVLLVFY